MWSYYVHPRFRVEFTNGLPVDKNLIAMFIRAPNAYAVGEIVKKMLGRLSVRFTVTLDE